MRSWCSLLCAPWPQQSLRFGSTKRILQLLRQRPVLRTVATHTVPRSLVCSGVLHACGVLTGWKSAGRDAYGSRYPYGYPHSPYHSPGDHGHAPPVFHSLESPQDKYQRGNLISPRSGLRMDHVRMDHVAHRHNERSRRDDRDIRRENPTRPTWVDGDPIQRTERTRAQRAAAPTPQSLPESPDSLLPERVHENRLREVLNSPTPTCLRHGRGSTPDYFTFVHSGLHVARNTNQERAKLQEQERERARLRENSMMSGVERSLGVMASPRARSSRGHPDAQAANSHAFPTSPVCDLVCVYARANLEKQATTLI
jgi:hypothetical protein